MSDLTVLADLNRNYIRSVDEADSTCVVPPGCVARLDDYGNIEIELDA